MTPYGCPGEAQNSLISAPALGRVIVNSGYSDILSVLSGFIVSLSYARRSLSFLNVKRPRLSSDSTVHEHWWVWKSCKTGVACPTLREMHGCVEEGARGFQGFICAQDTAQRLSRLIHGPPPVERVIFARALGGSRGERGSNIRVLPTAPLQGLDE